MSNRFSYLGDSSSSTQELGPVATNNSRLVPRALTGPIYNPNSPEAVLNSFGYATSLTPEDDTLVPTFSESDLSHIDSKRILGQHLQEYSKHLLQNRVYSNNRHAVDGHSWESWMALSMLGENLIEESKNQNAPDSSIVQCRRAQKDKIFGLNFKRIAIHGHSNIWSGQVSSTWMDAIPPFINRTASSPDELISENDTALNLIRFAGYMGFRPDFIFERYRPYEGKDEYIDAVRTSFRNYLINKGLLNDLDFQEVYLRIYSLFHGVNNLGPNLNPSLDPQQLSLGSVYCKTFYPYDVVKENSAKGIIESNLGITLRGRISFSEVTISQHPIVVFSSVVSDYSHFLREEEGVRTLQPEHLEIIDRLRKTGSTRYVPQSMATAYLKTTFIERPKTRNPNSTAIVHKYNDRPRKILADTIGRYL